MQALGESRVKILDGILRLLAQKTQDEQQQIYVLIKSFIDSKDTNTQNIGKYLMLKSTTQ